MLWPPLLLSLAPAQAARPTQVVAGDAHVCALDTRGRVTCWGDNQHGQLGRPPGSQPTGPVAIAVPRMRDLTASSTVTCGLTREGAVFCWGTAGDHLFTGPTEASSWLVEGAERPPGRLDTLFSRGTNIVCGAAGIEPYCLTPSLIWRRVAARPTQYAGTNPGMICGRTGGQVSCHPSSLTHSWNLVLDELLDSEPIDLAGNAIDLAVGDIGCARLEDGRMQCFDHDGRTRPPELPRDQAFEDVAVGNQFVCVVQKRAVWCEGAWRSGQLGWHPCPDHESCSALDAPRGPRDWTRIPL